MTYVIAKKAIEVQKQRGTLNQEDMMSKLDVFLLNGRVTEDEYNKLLELMRSE